ncbi:hypothetical protein SEA_MEDIUMFRY_33 [Arthrobacter phage MediumFry]|nr:hypothetical protein SEA_MEDIUMFRY_33 [Arthrobacter phage MediumFry]
MTMSDFNEKIVKVLKERPGRVIVNPEGTYLYALSADINGNDIVIRLTSEKNLREMTTEEVNQFIIDQLRRK